MTYTVSRLAVSKASFEDIAARIRAIGGYDFMFITPTSIDMTHVAIEPEEDEK